MKYIILGAEAIGDTLNTKVEFDFEGKKVETVISHFQPTSREEIFANIENRAASEDQKLKASEKIILLVQELANELNKEIGGAQFVSEK